MGPRPNTTRGTALEDAPFSMTTTDFAAPPFVTTGEAHFMDTTEVSLSCRTTDARIRYTVDGSEPTASSPLYEGPIQIQDTVTLKARAFGPNLDPSPVVSHPFKKATFESPAQVQDLVPGLQYEYFEGRYRSVTQLKNPIKRGTVQQIDLSMRNRDDDFGVIYNGYLSVPQDGMYTFYLASDDGTRLLLNDKLLIDNDGPHGANFVQKHIALAQGMHKLQIKYFEGAVTEEIHLEWSGPNLPRAAVPAKALFMTSE